MWLSFETVSFLKDFQTLLLHCKALFFNHLYLKYMKCYILSINCLLNVLLLITTSLMLILNATSGLWILSISFDHSQHLPPLIINTSLSESNTQQLSATNIGTQAPCKRPNNTTIFCPVWHVITCPISLFL